jgi:AraC-like DNA-binding protein
LPGGTRFDEFRVSLAYLRGLFTHLRLCNVPIAPVLAAIGVTEEDLADHDRQVADASWNVAFAVAERLTGDRNVGLHAARSMQVMDLGIVGHIAIVCHRARDLFDLHARYAHLVSNTIQASYETQGSITHLRLRTRGELHSRQVIDFNLAGWLLLLRMLAGTELRPLRIDLHCEAPPDLTEHEAFFGCPLHYAYPTNGVDVAFESSLGDLPLLHGDPELRATLEAEARRRLNALASASRGTDQRIADVRACVAERLARGAPEIEDIASAMGTSARTLQRELGRSGTTYRDLLDDLRKELAGRYVRDATLSLVDVALMLGFADQTTFQRAFRRWFDATPGAMRRGLR